MGRTFYVDANNGSDANAGTAPQAAWQSLDRVSALALGPGDAVLLARGGVWHGTLSLQGSGAAGAPIVIGAYGDGAPPEITGGHVGIDGNGQDHVVVSQIRITDMGGPGIVSTDSADWTIDHVTIANTGQWHDGASRDFSAIQFWNSQGLTVSNSLLTDIQGDAIWGWEIDGLKILNNRIETVRGASADNIHLYAPHNFEIRGNYLSMEGATDSGKGNLHSQAGSGGIVAHNEMRGGNYGVGMTDSNLRVENNLIVNHNQESWSSGILVSEVYDVANNTYVGNTIENARMGIYSYQDYARDNFEMHGNVFKDIGTAALVSEGPMNGRFTGNTIVGPGDAVWFSGWESGPWDASGNAHADSMPASALRTISPAPVPEVLRTAEVLPGPVAPAPAPAPEAPPPAPDLAVLMPIYENHLGA